MTKPKDIGTIYVITNNINGKEYVGQTWYDMNFRFGKINNKAGDLSVRKKISQSSLKKTDDTTIVKIEKMLGDGMTQQRVADSLGISQSYVSRIINRNRRTL